jgi:hypothetical protein
MRRRGLEAEGLEIVCRRSVAKGLMRPVAGEAAGEGVDEVFGLSMRWGGSQAA